ncbi:DUF1659 domain-containing protein [Sporomusa sphaeroides]|uniref:DUF1659 domain-containing protein n=1 Tax=Sporomusa sphaeroides DSM 2875 TaxID=1337886 RepID=A0ABM9WA08_9FIRM|nr:DUF1659 domain-containing protein [Sporomusa sphaeroides]OLS54253.1 hypothetical protein SPSPH_46250 [Sporomusa sphaeroides DSM 2875]CVK21879.1 hypothetical protein SSPH_04598 [Sporomusa sphaeroides DSM 2875]
MALVKIPQKSTIAIKLQRGVTPAGSPTYVTRNYPAKSTAADQDLFDIGLALMSLQVYPVTDIERVDTAYLVNQ